VKTSKEEVRWDICNLRTLNVAQVTACEINRCLDTVIGYIMNILVIQEAEIQLCCICRLYSFVSNI